MQKIEYLFSDAKNVHVIQCKVSANQKIGFGVVVQTYHFSLEQIKNLDISLDGNNCLNCPLSFSNGHILGRCYTHNGNQYRGLISMLKRLNRLYLSGEIKTFNLRKFETFYNIISSPKYNISLVRFGAYGEPVLLGEMIISKISKVGKNITGYTHTWNDKKYHWANQYFMSSVHNLSELKRAKNKNFRSFFVAENSLKTVSGVNCPASKEANYKSSCIACSLCSGNFKSLKKDIKILMH